MRSGRRRWDALFLDRDGTLIAEREYLGDPSGVQVVRGTTAALRRFVEAGTLLFVVSNQAGIARGLLTWDQVNRVNAEVDRRLARGGVPIAGWFVCPHHPDGTVAPWSRRCACRKPGTLLLRRALAAHGLDAARCAVIGDKLLDVQTGLRVGAAAVHVLTGHGRAERPAVRARAPGALLAPSLPAALHLLALLPERARTGHPRKRMTRGGPARLRVPTDPLRSRAGESRPSVPRGQRQLVGNSEDQTMSRPRPPRVTTYPIATRRFKVKVDDFAAPPAPVDSFSRFWRSLPRMLAADSLRKVAAAIHRARRAGKPVVFAFGAHVLKTGLAPVLVDLIERGFITALATNGASGIHDFEVAYHGQTSEDVGSVLLDGEFGMSRETGVGIFRALKAGRPKGWGYGRSVGEAILRGRFPNRHLSLFAAAAKAGIPLTVHVALGTDTLVQHPGMDGALVGEMSIRDFGTIRGVIGQLGGGGVWINAGSAVILPEVFLKALSMARNLGADVRDFTTVDLDMIRHYRPHENVLKRPVMAGGQSFALTGHHELMLPLLAQALVLGLEEAP